MENCNLPLESRITEVEFNNLLPYIINNPDKIISYILKEFLK